MWNLDSFQSLLRAVLKIGGGFLLAKGLADESALETITAGVLALAAVLWGICHRNPEKPRQVTLTELPLLLFFGVALLTACASANTTAFRAEKFATDTAHAALLTWKAYYSVALPSAPPAELPFRPATWPPSDSCQMLDLTAESGSPPRL